MIDWITRRSVHYPGLFRFLVEWFRHWGNARACRRCQTHPRAGNWEWFHGILPGQDP